MAESFDLARFVTAQDPLMPQVLEELGAGRKRSHWMWFIFPQLAALGQSQMSRFYGIASIEEARAYLGHPVLGPRLVDCTRLVNHVDGHSAHAIFGSPDDMKFRSSMTLFDAVRPQAEFRVALDRFYAGDPDPRSLALLRGERL